MKKDLYKWRENNILFSEKMAFRAKDKKLLEHAFRLWFKLTIEEYGRSKWIELKMQTRREK